MVQTADSVEWTVVASEVEALQLEYTWIKRFDPRFNVMYRDDKTYPMLAVSVGEQVPRVFFYRGPRKRGVRYFGPYAHAWAVRETMDLLLRVFPMRSCSSGVYRRHERLGRPCLLGYIDKCDAPCIGRVSADEHRETVNGLVGFMRGRTNDVVKRLTADMEKASEELEFEKAARLRDDLGAIDKLMEQQTVVLGDGTAADLIAFADDELEAAVQIFHVRDGRIRGQRGWVVEKLTELPELIENFLVQFYSDAAEREEMEAAEDAKLIDRRGVDQESRLEIQEHDEAARTTTRDVIPRQIMVHTEPQDVKQVSTVLSDLRGGSVEVRVPQRGEKKALMDTVYRNALDALKQHKLKRVGDLTARSAALQDLQTSLFLDSAPLRIECIDISHIQGTDVVASLVVFEDGLPRKASYRRYRIKEAAGGGHSDDVASIAEVTRRRFKRHQDDKLHVPDEELEASTFADEDVTEESADGNRFAYPPQLFVVDGGLPQVNAAQKVFDDLGVNDVALIGLAKRLEEIWVPGEEEPIILPRGSEALYLLQHIRDEAHRFAISYHRQQRSKRMRSSALDAVPGLGPARRADLVKHFGSVKKLKQASVKEITEVKGFGPALAESIYAALHK